MSGANKYIPEILLKEIEEIKKEENFTTDNDAMIKLVEHSKIGREMEKIVYWYKTK